MLETDGTAGQPAVRATTSVPAARPGLVRSIAHRLAGDRVDLPVEGRLASFDGATGWLNSEPLTPEGLRGTGRPRRLLDLHLHQLDPHPSLRPGVGRQVRRRRPDRRRRPHPGVRLRAGHRQHRRASRAPSASSTRSRSTATTGSGKRSRITSGRRCTSPTAEGRIRFHHFGEGEYAMTEMVIQQLLHRSGRGGHRPGSGRRSSLAASRSPPTGARCDRPRRTSAMARARASRRTTSRRSTSRTPTPPAQACR